MLKITDNVYRADGKYGVYLIKDEKTVVVDTVCDEYAEEYVTDIKSGTENKKVDFLVLTHTEPHCKKFVRMMIAENPDIVIVGTIPAVKNLREILNGGFCEQIAKNNAELDVGAYPLRFIITPNLPCPDSMVVFIEKRALLFGGRLFSSESDTAGGAEEYYLKNLSPFRAFVSEALKRLPNDIKTICPYQGEPIKDNALGFIKKYEKLSEERSGEKITAVCFSPRGGYTERMARIVEKTLNDEGVGTMLVCADDKDAAKTLNSADAVVIGTSTLNKNARREILSLLAEADAVRLNGKPYFVFGSYGWSGEGTQIVHAYLKMLRMKPFSKPIGAYFDPSEKEEEELREVSANFAKMLCENG